MLLIFIIIVLFIYAKYLYSIIFIEGKIKIPYGEYKIRRIKYLIYQKHIDEIKQIAINSVGVVPNNPIFKGKKLDNKIVLIIYKNNTPIGLNIMFDYTYNKKKCLHTGLVLIDKKYQGNKLQSFAKINVILYTLENMFRSIYISDIGNSASGLRIFNKSIKNSYPNVIYNNKPDENLKKHANYLIKNLQHDILFSPKATFDDEKFIIRNARDTEDLSYLVMDECVATKSSDDRFNEYIKNNFSKMDDYLCMGKINLSNIFF